MSAMSRTASAQFLCLSRKLWLRDPCEEVSLGCSGMNETRNGSQRSHDYLSTENSKYGLY